MRRFIVFLLIFAFAFSVMPTSVFAEEAVVETIDFDNTDVLDDLKNGMVGDKRFDASDYSVKVDGVPQLLTVVEFCYSEKEDIAERFALYLYVFNPTAYLVDEDLCKVQMASTYDSDYYPTGYAKYSLTLCDASEDGLFLKFRVQDKVVNGRTIFSRVKAFGRRYDVSGMEIAYTGKDVQEYAVEKTYTFTGYAAGCGEDILSESTLMCNVNGLEVLPLQVKHTYYRTETSAKGKYYQNQLDMVYFSVPNLYFAEDTFLQTIRAQWYEYKLKEAIVTSYSPFYNAALPHLGVNGTEETKYTLLQDMSFFTIGGLQKISFSEWGYNAGWGRGGYYSVNESTDVLYNLFYTPDKISEYDMLGDKVVTTGAGSTDVLSHILAYSAQHADKPKLLDEDGKPLKIQGVEIVAELFESDIDAYRKLNTESGQIQYGHSYYSFDFEKDMHKLDSFASTSPSFWDNAANYGFFDSLFGNFPVEESISASPIEIVNHSFVQSATDEAIANTYFIRKQDVSDFKTYCAQAKDANETVVLFRFAATDYYSAPIEIVELDGIMDWYFDFIEDQAYRAKASMFLNFDVIELGFRKGEEYFVIPAATAPINILPDYTPPVDDGDDFGDFIDGVKPYLPGGEKSIPTWLYVLVITIILICLFPILIPLVQLFVKIILLLISVICRLFDFFVSSVRLLVRKRKKKKESNLEKRMIEEEYKLAKQLRRKRNNEEED